MTANVAKPEIHDGAGASRKSLRPASNTIDEAFAAFEKPILAAISKSLAEQEAVLPQAEAACKHHEERCVQFINGNNREAYRKERADLDFSEGRVEAIRAKIDAIKCDQAAATTRVRADWKLWQDKRQLVLQKSADVQPTLKECAAAIAFLAEKMPLLAEIYAAVAEFNGARPEGIEAIENPEAALRHSPGIPARQDGTRNVQRSRLRKGLENSNFTGADRYEIHTVTETVVIPEVPEFKPAPLFRRIIVPAFFRDGPSYSPPGVMLPW